MQKVTRLACLALLAAAGTARAAPEPAANSDTLDLSLEDLMQVVVTSVSKKSQTLAETSAAAAVISADDIRRSGATSIPEALRLAPGVQVSAMGNNKWAVSIRGFADRFSNKLLVLVDGRSVYTPLFSGVFWENLDVPLENIARIEVIRGPGASIWGANAVNGVINIITKSAFDSLGGQAAGAAGTELQGYGMLRYGWSPGPDTAVAVHLMAQNAGPSQTPDGRVGEDDWLNQTIGASLDHVFETSTLRVEGSVSRSLAGDAARVSLAPPSADYTAFTQRTDSQSLMVRWESRADAVQNSVQAYVTHSEFEHVMLDEQRTTANVEFQQHAALAERHDLIWGLGFRVSEDRIQSTPIVSVSESRHTCPLYSAYVQDEITLQPQRWRLTAGARFEYNESTHFGVQPNLRLLWTPNARQSAWISLARALRSPSRIEEGPSIYRYAIQPGMMAPQPPMLGETTTGPIDDESLDALDLGWRAQLSPTASLDVAAFYYDYDSLRGGRLGAPYLTPPGYLVIPRQTDNSSRAEEYGAEVSLDWRPLAMWRLQANYSWLEGSETSRNQQGMRNKFSLVSPTHQFSLRSALDLPQAWQWDVWLRAVSRIEAYDVPGFVTLDMRFAWRPADRLEFSLVGQNLLDAAHAEFGALMIPSQPTEVQRGGYVRLDWKF